LILDAILVFENFAVKVLGMLLERLLKVEVRRERVSVGMSIGLQILRNKIGNSRKKRGFREVYVKESRRLAPLISIAVQPRVRHGS